jgi:hypothetical protein
MFYSFSGNRRKPVDLDSTFSGTVFLLGGHPSLKEDPARNLLSRPGIATLAMNNTATLVRPTLWLGADNPKCYSPSILLDPGILKFGIIKYRDELVSGRPWKSCPSTFFSGTSNRFTARNLLATDRDLCWWKNVFMMAIQLSYRLGFRRLIFCGCAFNISKSEQYSYPTELTDDQIKYNVCTYNTALKQFVETLPHLTDSGLNLISATPQSRLNDHIPYQPLGDLIYSVVKDHPQPDTKYTLHSSHFLKNASDPKRDK